MSVNTKEKAFEEDMLNPSLTRLSVDKKCESVLKNIFGLLMEGEGGDNYSCFTPLKFYPLKYGSEDP